MDFDHDKKEFVLSGFERAVFCIENRRVSVDDTLLLLVAIESVLGQAKDSGSTTVVDAIEKTNPQTFASKMEQSWREHSQQVVACGEAAMKLILEHGQIPEINEEDFFQ